jgi:hypothetical protein
MFKFGFAAKHAAKARQNEKTEDDCGCRHGDASAKKAELAPEEECCCGGKGGGHHCCCED